MDLFTRIAKRNYVKRGGGAGQDHADEMMAVDEIMADHQSTLRRWRYLFAYVASVVAVNVLFSNWPELSVVWSLIVGGILVIRDFAQRAAGWLIWPAMALAVLITWAMADPFVALASAAAFAASELIDGLVYTWSRRPLRERVLWSSAAAAPIDSLIFLGIVGILTPGLFAAQVASKMVAAVIVWVVVTKWKVA